MGSRLTVYDDNDNIIYYGTKFYGYVSVDTLMRLDSFEFLSLYFDDDCRGRDDFQRMRLCAEFVTYLPTGVPTGKFTHMSGTSMREFLRLYVDDFNRFYGTNIEIKLDLKPEEWYYIEIG